MDPSQRDLYDAIASGPRARGPFRVVDDDGHLLGPFNALLHSPALGAAVQQVGSALRFGGTLPDRLREMVICAVGAAWGSTYEWYAHSRVAAGVGVSAAELAELADGRVPAGASSAEAAALRMTQALLAERAVDDRTHDDVRAALGDGGVVEVAVLVGYYQLLAGVLAAADVGAPDDPAAT